MLLFVFFFLFSTSTIFYFTCNFFPFRSICPLLLLPFLNREFIRFFFYYFYFPLLFCYIDICSDAVAIVATYGNNGMQLVKCYYVSLPIIYCCSVIKIFSEVCK